MATVKKVRRLANPFKRRKNAKGRRRNGRRRLTAKQIKFFGTKAQRASLKRRKRVANPRRRKTARRRTTRKNPALVVTLGALNPHRRRKNKMARRRRKSTTTKRRTRRTRRVVAVANPRRRRVYRRRSNPRRRAVSRRGRRRNPALFGARAFSGSGMKLVAGGLVGVAAAKFIPRMLPGGITGMLGNFGGLITTAASAFIAGWAAEKFIGAEVGSAVLFGGLMQTGSVALNMIAPGFAIGGVPLALSGMGELMPGSFVVPQNPLRVPSAPAVPTNARLTMNGLSRAFGTAF